MRERTQASACRTFGQPRRIHHGLHDLAHRRQIVLGQVARIGSRVGQNLVLFIERLRDRKRGLGGEPESAVGLALQGRQVVERTGPLARRFGLINHSARLPRAFGHNRLSAGAIPEPIRAGMFVGFGFAKSALKPLAIVLTGHRTEAGANFPVVTGDKPADLFLAAHDNGERRCLDPTDGG